MNKNVDNITGRVYDGLKLAGIILQYAAVFYLALAEQWGLPYAVQISASVEAFCALLNSVLRYCSGRYFSDKDIVPRGEE